MKTFFQKLLLSIPLRPGIAILFSFFIGFSGLFLPSGYLDVTYQEGQTISELSIPIHRERSGGSLYVDYCSVSNANWLVQPSWYFEMWAGGKDFLLIMLWLQYLSKHFPPTPKRLWLFFITAVVCAFIPIFIMLWLTPDSLNCPKDVTAIVHAITINGFAIFVWILSLLLGIYALAKGNAISNHHVGGSS